ncbi:MAG: serine/threonine protein kinase [Planctomycetes bacterium]|nr:serine/threonine protein kinase [Planctomycetota bacterium]
MTPADPSEVIALLEERARRLAPPTDLVDRAIARCGARESRRAAAIVKAVEAPVKEPESEATSATVLSGSPATDQGDTGKTVADSLVTAAPGNNEGLERGRVIAGYRIEGTLGKGGMGQVYRATQLSVERPVALKVLSPRLARDQDFRERFLREARAAGRLHHFNLIAVHDVGEAGGMMFFSMELVEGRTVKDLIAANELTIDSSLDIARQTLHALAYAHQHGVIHRDIKPDNIMVGVGGAVKVADLGLSRIDDPGSRAGDHGATHAGTIMGTPHYMSPEQGRDAHGADHRSDLYSLGATLYHMVCGRVPFVGTSPVDVVLKASTLPLTFPEPGPPSQLRAFIATLMAKDPAERPASAKEALAILDRVRRTDSFTADPSKRIRRYISRRRGMRRLLQTAAVLVIALVALALTVAIIRSKVADSAWRDERVRIQRLAGAGDYAEAIAKAQAAAERAQAGTPESARALALRSELETSWDGWSQSRCATSLTAFDVALKDKRFTEASKALKDIPSAAISPKWRSILDERRDTFDRTIEEALASKPADDKRLSWEEIVREREVGFANALWKEFSFTPTETVAFKDGVARFTGNGRGTLAALQSTRPRQAAIEFRLRPAAALTGSQRWQLSLGGSEIVVDQRGVTLKRDGHAESPVASATQIDLRIRRSTTGYMLYAGNQWVQLADLSDGRLQVQWRLDPGNSVDVAVRPMYLGDRLKTK